MEALKQGDREWGLMLKCVRREASEVWDNGHIYAEHCGSSEVSVGDSDISR